jgi:hypothetical protein
VLSFVILGANTTVGQQPLEVESQTWFLQSLLCYLQLRKKDVAVEEWSTLNSLEGIVVIDNSSSSSTIIREHGKAFSVMIRIRFDNEHKAEAKLVETFVNMHMEGINKAVTAGMDEYVKKNYSSSVKYLEGVDSIQVILWEFDVYHRIPRPGGTPAPPPPLQGCGTRESSQWFVTALMISVVTIYFYTRV